MTETTTFRFPTKFHELIRRLSKTLNTSRTEVIQQSVTLTAALLAEASRESYADLFELRALYGNDARIVIGVFAEDDQPVGRVIINGKPVDDVIARPFVDTAAGEAHMFLDVVRPHTTNPNFAKIGDEALFIAHPRFPVGSLPWPPRANLAIVLELADIERLHEAEQAARTPLEV
ncbi:MAG: hypothetical protein H0U46_04500 [Actinobacteria bacterium]|nr:hypothetical protein [Actinomycetota bacterium]